MIRLREKIERLLQMIPIGDQLGMAVETYSMEKIKAEYTMVTNYYSAKGNHPFFPNLEPRWTDDWLFTADLMKSLMACNGIDMDHIAENSIKLLKNGLKEFGAGKTTINSLQALAGGVHWSECGIPIGNNLGGGNGVAMKVAPIAGYLVSIYLQKTTLSDLQKWEITENEGEAIANLAMMTHKSQLGIASGFAQIYALIYCLKTEPSEFKKKEFVDFVAKGIGVVFERSYGKNRYLQKNPAIDLLLKIESLNYIDLDSMPYDHMTILSSRGSCYVIDSLMLTYMMFLKNPVDISTLYRTVSAGGDTDTNGAMVGALLGALNGYELRIPNKLVDELWKKNDILELIDGFVKKFTP
jgi:ADP-ribosylglycohydrolase